MEVLGITSTRSFEKNYSFRICVSLIILMYRYRIESADCRYGIRYGALQAEAAACSSSTSGVYFVSNCDICFLNVFLIC